MIIDRGYAVATMCYHDIFPDKPELKDHSSDFPFPGYDPQKTDSRRMAGYRSWVWGLSRIVDFWKRRIG